MLHEGAKRRYDIDEIKRRTADIVYYYLGSAKEEPARLLWDCPACQKSCKLSLRKEDQLFGCLVDSCTLHRADDIDFIAFQESLDSKSDFVQVLARGAEILGLDDEKQRSHTTKLQVKDSVSQHHEHKPSEGGEKPKKSLDERLALCNEVFSRIMELCPLEDRDRRYLRGRGLSYPSIRKGAFGSISDERARYLKAKLLEEFGQKKLLEVPGFFVDGPTKRLGFTLTGDYLLIPYHDRQGRITTIEGRTQGPIKDGMGKYVSLRGSGSHLYLFPSFEAEEIEAFTEGSFGAMVAADNGLAVASIQGCERYRASSSSSAPDGESGGPLLELRGADLRGRTIAYIPDADDPPNENVLKAARKAAHHLIERQGGKATLCSLPKGMDLDEWLLSIPRHDRQDQFRRLLSRAKPLAQADEWEEAQRSSAQKTNSASLRPEGPRTEGDPSDGGSLNGAASPSRTDRESEEAGRESAEVGVSSASETIPATDEGAQQPEQSAQQDTDLDTNSEASQDTANASSETENGKEEAPPAARSLPRTTAAHRLRDRVYRRLLENAPLKSEHMVALANLGVYAEAARVACLGSLDSERITEVSTELRKEFGTKQLLRVPGFECSQAGHVTLSLPKSTEYVLFPFFEDVLVQASSEKEREAAQDQAGDEESQLEVRRVVSGVEVLEYDPEKAGFTDPDRTLGLKGAGAHLYLFPAYCVEELEGFCEGPLGVLLAAQEDVVFGAVGHFRRYTADGGSAKNTAGVGQTLPQLAGVDFGGREVCYVPKTGAGEVNARSEEALVALRFLVEKQNGTGKLLGLGAASEGEYEQETQETQEVEAPAGPTSLYEWLLRIPEEERHDHLRGLFPRSPLRAAELEEGEETQETDEQQEIGSEEGSGLAIPTGGPLTVVGILSVVACVLSFLAIRKLGYFSEYVSTSFDGQPMIESGTLGALRLLLQREPFATLYDLNLPVSILTGLMAFCAGVLYWNFLRTAAARRTNLQRFARTPVWTAHRLQEEMETGSGEASATTRLGGLGSASLKVVLESCIGGAIVLVVLLGLLAAGRRFYSLLTYIGAVEGSYQSSMEMLWMVCVVVALMCGAYVGMRRSVMRRKERRIADGTIVIN